jgi:hemoglobin
MFSNRAIRFTGTLVLKIEWHHSHVAFRKNLSGERKMKKIAPFLYFTLLVFAAVAPYCAAPPQAFAQPPNSLYHRLGGYDALAAVTDDFVGRLAADPALHRFFTGLSVDSQKKLRQHVVDFLCSATGGPCIYTGRDMKTAHTGLGITEDDWNVSVKHLVATLDKFKVPEKEKNEVLGAISGLKGDIVGK